MVKKSGKWKINNIDYKDFNRLYECEYIKTIGKLMY